MPARSSRLDCFAVCVPGLEAVVLHELEALGIAGPRPGHGGVTFRATTRQLYAANLWLRTATRVLVRMARFRAGSFASLEDEVRGMDWDAWLAGDARPAFRVSSSGSKLYHTGAVEERLLRLVGGQPDDAGAQGNPNDTDRRDELVQGFVVRIAHDEVTISADSSGAPLHERGWRGPQGKAPLRETLAAAMVLASGWDEEVALVDPFCGSGTIAIEAAMIGRGLAPGWQREFAFGSWPTFEPGTWASVAGAARESMRPLSAEIVASDRDDGAVDAAAENAERAGVADHVVVRRATVSELASTQPRGWVLANPPYGRRVSGGTDLRNLYASLGEVMRTALPDWDLGILAADARTAGHCGMRLTERFATTNGGIPVQFLVHESHE